jgi:hypothetical protein
MAIDIRLAPYRSRHEQTLVRRLRLLRALAAAGALLGIALIALTAPPPPPHEGVSAPRDAVPAGVAHGAAPGLLASEAAPRG